MKPNSTKAALKWGPVAWYVCVAPTATGGVIHTSTPDEFAAFIRSEHARRGEVIRQTNSKAE